MHKKQTPGTIHTFVTALGSDTGVLPSSYGLSNEFAMWRPHKRSSTGGSWRSRKFHSLRFQNNYRGVGKDGLLGRMKVLFYAAKARDTRQGYQSPDTTPEKMLDSWFLQNGICPACGSSIDLLEAAFDHDHRTGEPRGFIHKRCNWAEGYIHTMSNSEFENFVTWERSKRGQNGSI
jgi:hypothetical protein